MGSHAASQSRSLTHRAVAPRPSMRKAPASANARSHVSTTFAPVRLLSAGVIAETCLEAVGSSLANVWQAATSGQGLAGRWSSCAKHNRVPMTASRCRAAPVSCPCRPAVPIVGQHTPSLGTYDGS